MWISPCLHSEVRWGFQSVNEHSLEHNELNGHTSNKQDKELTTSTMSMMEMLWAQLVKQNPARVKAPCDSRHSGGPRCNLCFLVVSICPSSDAVQTTTQVHRGKLHVVVTD